MMYFLKQTFKLSLNLSAWFTRTIFPQARHSAINEAEAHFEQAIDELEAKFKNFEGLAGEHFERLVEATHPQFERFRLERFKQALEDQDFKSAEYQLSLLHLDETDDSGKTALHWAAKSGYEKGVGILLDEGLNPNVADALWYTPFHLAIVYGHEATAHTLIERGADTTALAGFHQNSAAVLAAKCGRTTLVTSLLDREQNASVIEALHRAIYFHHVDTIKVLLPRAALREQAAINPGLLLIACASDTLYMNTDLGAHGAPTAGSPMDETAKLLLDWVDVNAAVDGGQTILHYCAELGWRKGVEFFMENRADPMQEDDNGDRPIDLAPESSEVKEILANFDDEFNKLRNYPGHLDNGENSTEEDSISESNEPASPLQEDDNGVRPIDLAPESSEVKEILASFDEEYKKLRNYPGHLDNGEDSTEEDSISESNEPASPIRKKRKP